MKPTTLLTVGYHTDGVFIERSARMLAQLTEAPLVAQHLVYNNSTDPEFTERLKAAYGRFAWPTQFVQGDRNLCDLPAYNILAQRVQTPDFVIFSPDTRLFTPHWLSSLLGLHRENYAAITGNPGPGWNITEDNWKAEQWGWVGGLLALRGLRFVNCSHVQTWCCAIDTELFRKVGGFWKPEGECHKGDLIAGEIYLSVCLSRAGGKLQYGMPPAHHYGTRNADQPGALEALNAFDQDHGWPAL